MATNYYKGPQDQELDETQDPRILEQILAEKGDVARPYTQQGPVGDVNQQAITAALDPSYRDSMRDQMGGNTGAAGDLTEQAKKLPNGGIADSAAAPAADTSGWDTDGYATPGFTASNFGNAPAGYDQGKWTNANHQSPKYVVGRLQAEAGGDKAKFAQLLAQAYPGASFNGKDKISGIPGIGTVDVYRGASVGENGIQWDTGEGSAPQQIDNGGVALAAPSADGGSSVPGELFAESTYQKLIKQLQEQAAQGTDQQALSQILGGR